MTNEEYWKQKFELQQQINDKLESLIALQKEINNRLKKDDNNE